MVTMKRGVIILTCLLVICLVAAGVGYARQRERARRALIEAIKTNNSSQAAAATKSGADPNAHDKSEEPPVSPDNRLK